jgi:hypothetical protein
MWSGVCMETIKATVTMPDNCYILKTSKYHCIDKGGRSVYEHKSKKHPYYLVWDGSHGEIEVFSKKTLKHVAVYYPNGDFKSGPVKGRELKI